MSLSISAVSANNTQQHDTELAPKPTAVAPALKLAVKPAITPSLKPAVAPSLKPAVKLSASQQVDQLALQGQSAKQIATVTGLPESEVELDLGTTSSSSTSSTSQASALLALGARLSVQA
jgi:hypothetical protein